MSVLAQQLTSGSQSSPSLASNHSLLVRTLEQAPRLTEQQLKHTDIIHNYIMGNNSDSASSTNHEAATARMLYGVPNVQQQYGHSNTSSGKGVVVCPPGYYIPHHQTSSWPFASAAVRPAATFVPQQTVVHHHHQILQTPPRLSPQPPSPSVVVVSASASPQPAGSPKLPRMYYDPRSNTPTSQAASAGSSSAVTVTMGGVMNYGCGVVASKSMSPAMPPQKPASPLAGQVLEIQQVTSGENQPLNLSKKVAMVMNHKVKIEMSS